MSTIASVRYVAGANSLIRFLLLASLDTVAFSSQLAMVEDRFSDYDAIDSHHRAEILRTSLDIEGDPQPYTAEEEQKLKMTCELEHGFAKIKNTWHPRQRSSLSEEVRSGEERCDEQIGRSFTGRRCLWLA